MADVNDLFGIPRAEEVNKPKPEWPSFDDVSPWNLPIGASASDHVKGYRESGQPIYETTFGSEYSLNWDVQEDTRTARGKAADMTKAVKKWVKDPTFNIDPEEMIALGKAAIKAIPSMVAEEVDSLDRFMSGEGTYGDLVTLSTAVGGVGRVTSTAPKGSVGMFQKGVYPQRYVETEYGQKPWFTDPVSTRLEAISNYDDFPKKGIRGSEIIKELETDPLIRGSYLSSLDLPIDKQKRYFPEDILKIGNQRIIHGDVRLSSMSQADFSGYQRQSSVGLDHRGLGYVLDDFELPINYSRTNNYGIDKDAPRFQAKATQHFDEDTLAHSRGSIYVDDKTGKKTLLVEELQSDLLQGGAEKARGPKPGYTQSTQEAFELYFPAENTRRLSEGEVKKLKDLYQTLYSDGMLGSSAGPTDFGNNLYSKKILDSRDFKKFEKHLKGYLGRREAKEFLDSLKSGQSVLRSIPFFEYNTHRGELMHLFTYMFYNPPASIPAKPAVGKPPIKKFQEGVDLNLKGLIAFADTQGVDTIVIPNLQKLAEARFKKDSPEYNKAMTEGSTFVRTYVDSLGKTLDDLEDTFGDNVDISIKGLPYRSDPLSGTSDLEEFPSIFIDISKLRKNYQVDEPNFDQGGLVTNPLNDLFGIPRADEVNKPKPQWPSYEEVNPWNLPIGASGSDTVIGHHESGQPIYRTNFGAEYSLNWDTPEDTRTMRGKAADATKAMKEWVKDPEVNVDPARIVEVGKAVVQSIPDIAKEELHRVEKLMTGQGTYGDLVTLASEVGVGGFATSTAPKGSVGVFAGRQSRTGEDKYQKATNMREKWNIGRESFEPTSAANERLWKRTGTFVGPDRKWRWEIDDSTAKVKSGVYDDPVDIIRRRADERADFMTDEELLESFLPYFKLDEAIDHPELFKEYPILDNINVVLDPDIPKGGASYGGGTIRVNPDSVSDPDEFKSLILHETQHAVQEIEDFSRGGRPDFFADTETAAVLKQKLDSSAHASKAAWEGLNPRQKHEVQYYLQTQDYDINDLDDKVAEYLLLLNEQRFAKHDVDKYLHSRYESLSGEEEARLVERRLKYTPEERRAVNPGYEWQETRDIDQPDIPTEVYYGDKVDPSYSKGGAVMKVDPISGNEVPAGASPEEVRDDIQINVSENEYVIPANVVKYYGIKKLEDLVSKANTDLEEMEAAGRLGGESRAAGGLAGSNDAFDADDFVRVLKDASMNDPKIKGAFNKAGLRLGYANGGLIEEEDIKSGYSEEDLKTDKDPFKAYEWLFPGSSYFKMKQSETRIYINKDGKIINIDFINGKPQQKIPKGFVPIEDAKDVIGKDEEEDPNKDSPDAYIGGEGHQVNQDHLDSTDTLADAFEELQQFGKDLMSGKIMREAVDDIRETLGGLRDRIGGKETPDTPSGTTAPSGTYSGGIDRGTPTYSYQNDMGTKASDFSLGAEGDAPDPGPLGDTGVGSPLGAGTPGSTTGSGTSLSYGGHGKTGETGSSLGGKSAGVSFGDSVTGNDDDNDDGQGLGGDAGPFAKGGLVTKPTKKKKKNTQRRTGKGLANKRQK